jgi:hypothetical protein
MPISSTLTRVKIEIDGLSPPSAPCSSSLPVNPIARIERENEEAGELGIYSCQIESEPSGPTEENPDDKRLFSLKPGERRIEFQNSNDNLFLGLVHSGDDLGFTFGVGLSYDQALARNSKLGKKGDLIGFELNTQLYTVKAAHDLTLYHELHKKMTRDQASFGSPAETGSNPVWYDAVEPEGGKLSKRNQQFLNATQLKAYKEWDRKTYFVKGVVGFETRKTSGKPEGVVIQDAWHRMLDIYRWNSFDPEGHESTIIRKPSDKVDPALEAQGVRQEKIEVQIGVQPNEDLEKFGKWATSAGGAVGRRAHFFQARCQLEAMVSADLVVQGEYRGVRLDSNSNLAVHGNAQAALLKNKKWGDSRLNLKLGSALMYFPERFDSTHKTLRFRGSGEIESLSHLGKKGDRLGVALQVYTPGGGGTFQKLDDDDPVMRIAFRYLFGSSQPKK